MKRMDCKLICREIDELDAGQAASLSVLEHTRGCVNCKQFLEDRFKLRQLVANSGTIVAPADFEFRLRARLANEKARQPSTLFGRIPAISFPSVVLASLALLIGVGFATQGLWVPGTGSNVAVSDAQKVNPASTRGGPSQLAPTDVAVGLPVEAVKSPIASNGVASNERKRAPSRFIPSAKSERLLASKAINSKRVAGAKRENPLSERETASMFPIEASEPLRVSLDYASGVSRTISLPALSFGSQETRGGVQMVKTSAKGIW